MILNVILQNIYNIASDFVLFEAKVLSISEIEI